MKTKACTADAPARQDTAIKSGQARFDSLQIFRGIAAVGVVYHHLYVIAPRFLGFEYNGLFARQCDLGVDFFFVLSGFIITWMHLKDLGRPGRLLPYLSKRIIRIYPLVWLVVSVKLLAGWLIPAVNVSGKNSINTVAASFLLFPHDQYVIDVQWTLACEVLFYSIFGLWILGGKKAAIVSGVVWGAAILLLPHQSPRTPLDFLLAEKNFEFLGGCVTACLLSVAFLPVRPAVVLVIAAFIAAVAGFVINIRSPFFWTFACSSLVAGAVSLDFHRWSRWPRWAVYLGDASYSVYLTHTSVQMLIVVAGKRIGLDFYSTGQLLLQLAGVVSVFTGLACYRWVEKPMSRGLRHLLAKPSVSAPV